MRRIGVLMSLAADNAIAHCPIRSSQASSIAWRGRAATPPVSSPSNMASAREAAAYADLGVGHYAYEWTKWGLGLGTPRLGRRSHLHRQRCKAPRVRKSPVLRILCSSGSG